MEKDHLILACLRRNARASLAQISRETGIPVSTVFDRIKRIERKYLIKHTSILDLQALGKALRVNIIFSSQLPKVEHYLFSSPKVNSVYRTDSGFFVEGIFSNMAELQDFYNDLDSLGAKDRKEFHILDELKREEFLTDVSHF